MGANSHLEKQIEIPKTHFRQYFWSVNMMCRYIESYLFKFAN